MKNRKFVLISLIVFLMMGIVAMSYKSVLKNINYGLDLKGGFEVLYKVEPLTKKEKLTDDMVKATYKSIVNRVDSLGVSEPEITVEGDKIRVKLAGVKNEKEARERLSKPAVLSFRDTSDNLLMNAKILGSPAAKLDYRSQNEPVVSLKIDDKDKFYSVTKKISNMSDNRIVIWLDFVEGTDSIASQGNNCGTDGNMKCISSATVSQAFASDVVIEGSFNQDQAQELVDLINSGSLPTKMTEVSSKTVDASFGSNTLNIVAIAGIIIMASITILMTLIYRFSGFISSLCMIAYSLLVFLIFNLMDGVLTLPGIAALILGIAMAIDASIISIERIKDELRHGKTLEASEKLGNKRSLIAIIDANITTMIVAVVLFIFGESSVKGFATMLILTIILTVIIMVILNRAILKEYVKSGFFAKKVKAFTGVKTDNIVKIDSKQEPKDGFEKIDFVKNHKKLFAASIIIIIIGAIFLGFKGLHLGIDFTGGSDISIKSSESVNMKKALNGVKEYNVIESQKVNNKEGYIKLGDTLEKKDIDSIKLDFKKHNMSADISVISNVVKKDLIKNAFISVIIALGGILLYIAFRFTWNYGVATVISLTHDILIVVAFFAVFGIEINFIFIAAVLTVIGYSINDTIICFDRMRENNLKWFKGKPKTEKDLETLVNRSLRQTLFRSLFTSLTTILAVVILILVGANEILNFNLALLIGLVAGTYSSIFIAAQIWLIKEKKDLKTPKVKKKKNEEIEEKSVKGINS